MYRDILKCGTLVVTDNLSSPTSTSRAPKQGYTYHDKITHPITKFMFQGKVKVNVSDERNTCLVGIEKFACVYRNV